MDSFTSRRLIRFLEDHRAKTGQLPTFQDFDRAGFPKDLIKEAVRAKLIEEYYLRLTNGTVVKGFRVASP